jgi:hypothetical protein
MPIGNMQNVMGMSLLQIAADAADWARGATRLSRRGGGSILVWACLAAAGVGLAIGLRFRVTFLLATAGLMSAATVAVAILLGWSFSHTIAVLALLLAIQQGSYLIGVLASLRR